MNTDLSFCVTGGDTIDKITGTNIERPYYVNYNDIIAYLIASIKELDIIVQEQQNTINNQETKILNLEEENSLIKSKLNELLLEAGKGTI